MQALQEGELTIRRRLVGPELIRLEWLGRSNHRRPDDVLNPFLFEVLDQALRQSAGVELRFERLDFLNSSTVAVLVHFLQRARSHGVKLTFTYRSKLRWQRMCFEALRVFEQVDRLVNVVALPDAIDPEADGQPAPSVANLRGGRDPHL